MKTKEEAKKQQEKELVQESNILKSIKIPIVGKKQDKKVLEIFLEDKIQLLSLKKVKKKQIKKFYEKNVMKIEDENLCNKYV